MQTLSNKTQIRWGGTVLIGAAIVDIAFKNPSWIFTIPAIIVGALLIISTFRR